MREGVHAMRVGRSRRPLRGTWLRLVALWALCSLSLVAASCGRPADAPGPDHRLTSATCAALRAAVATTATDLPTPTGSGAHGHRTYTLTMLGPLPPQRIWHPGATMRFTWCAVAGPMTESPHPAAVVLTVQIEGPFPSFSAAAVAGRPSPGAGNSGTPPTFPPKAVGPIVVTIQPLHTDTWTGTDQAATIVLPTKLAPGFYLFVTASQVSPEPGTSSGQEGTSSYAGSASGVVQVTST
jgi:hypothetical protein